MTERHSFLRAIRESPDDDTPRLVYADWLEEHGEPERAELIRVSVARQRVGFGMSPREFELFRWFRDFYGMLTTDDEDKSWNSFDMPRGILERLCCTWPYWRTHGDLIWEKELPWRVRLTTWPAVDDMPKFEGYDRKDRLRWYSFSGKMVSIGDQDWDSHTVPEDHRLPMCLAARWPGIDFELPGVTAADVEAVIAERVR